MEYIDNIMYNSFRYQVHPSSCSIAGSFGCYSISISLQ